MAKGIRWAAAGIVAVVLAVVVAWALLVPAADWLAHHDVGAVTGSALVSARNNARGSLLTLAAGLVAAGALVFTATNVTLQRRSLELSQRNFEANAELARQTLELGQQDQQRTHQLTEQGQVTDRYTKAIEQLGSVKLDVRVGGIYALERIARDSARDHPTVIEVLTAFIREHSHEQGPGLPEPEREQAWGAPRRAPQRSTRADVQAAITVIGRRDTERDFGPVDLSGADLSGANLSGADLSGAILLEADLLEANLLEANLALAGLTAADLTGADLDGALLTAADLTSADLSGALLDGTDLTRADLSAADLSGANLTEARWPSAAAPPEGWRWDSSDGRLRRASGA